MAIIPRADESQVLNAGSPVPLVTGNTAGELMGSAVSSLEKAREVLIKKVIS